MNDVERDGSKSIGFQLRGQMFGSNPNVQTIQGSSLGAIHEPILVAERLQCPNKSLGGCWEVLHSPGLELVLGLSKLKRHPPTCTKTYLHTVNADDVGVSDEDVSLELRRYDETEPFRLAVTFDPAFVSLSSFFKFPALDITSSLEEFVEATGATSGSTFALEMDRWDVADGVETIGVIGVDTCCAGA
eukprot:CAMPEP_0206628632 /NCGR_PEP_ID=MMETSP0325_2-20121206/66617_1 /ASSEMBLY_ACC=CAM_ASM_000347 /TAXON_ID=2866 /ORGANISM="Crypthecodinium cohnii, Strain Seligo" /LENGTH=187 /DNA_ID=CAMNT_0054153385 /DNA_START=806 /DNA_END=1373 /DNA_ORIENTATION=-